MGDSRFQALTQHQLEDVAGGDVLAAAADGLFEIVLAAIAPGLW